jgi:AraC-like DNA-binding protein
VSERAGFDLRETHDPLARLPFASYVSLMRAGKELCNDSALALHFGEQVDLSEITVGCVIGGFAESGGEAFALMNRYSRLGVEAASSPVLSILSAHAEARLERLESARTTRARVEHILVPALHTGDVTIDATARSMGLSRQTLFRKLKAEGVTFQQVLDELRHRLALDYFGRQKGRKATVNQAAHLMGGAPDLHQHTDKLRRVARFEDHNADRDLVTSEEDEAHAEAVRVILDCEIRRCANLFGRERLRVG